MTAVASAGGKKDFSTIALIIGIVGLVIGLIGLGIAWNTGNSRPLFGWLIGFTYWFSIGIGMLFLLMITYVFDAGWAVVVRRQLEHGVSAFIPLAVIFLPLLAFALFYHDPGILWKWLNESKILPGGETVGADALYTQKSAYLNLGFFVFRVFFFFGSWIFLAWNLRRCSFSMEKDGDPKWARIAHNTSALGIYLCAFCATFAAVDWFKSLEFHWFSTMYGVWFFAESMRAGLAATVIVCMLLASKGYLRGLYNSTHGYLLGCLMLAFTVFWAYISFSQYFLIYNANLPEETYWYNIREINADGTKNSWWWVSMALVFGHFLFPFLYLLWYKNKFGARIVFISVWILVMHAVDIYWNILPGMIPSDENVLGFIVRPAIPSIWDLAAWAGVGGICVWAFLRSSKKVKPVPVRDPRILESIHAHE